LVLTKTVVATSQPARLVRQTQDSGKNHSPVGATSSALGVCRKLACELSDLGPGRAWSGVEGADSPLVRVLRAWCGCDDDVVDVPGAYLEGAGGEDGEAEADFHGRVFVGCDVVCDLLP